jgi:hypothetical protein
MKPSSSCKQAHPAAGLSQSTNPPPKEPPPPPKKKKQQQQQQTQSKNRPRLHNAAITLPSLGPQAAAAAATHPHTQFDHLIFLI